MSENVKVDYAARLRQVAIASERPDFPSAGRFFNEVADELERLAAENARLRDAAEAMAKLPLIQNCAFRWTDKGWVLIGPLGSDRIAEALEELREAGGKAWDDVPDVEAELGRKPEPGPATKAVMDHFKKALHRDHDGEMWLNSNRLLMISRDDVQAFLDEQEPPA